MPKVSVIVPNYNHARFLEQRIQSILNQTYQDFELIYLDDASTDNSNEVFAQFADSPRVRTILNQTNSGSPFKQWNKGIQHANGEYIWIAESDDFCDPSFLETLVAILDQHPNVGVAYCQSCQVDEHSHPLTTMHWWTDDLDRERWRNDFINCGLDECQNYLIIKNTIPNASAVLVRQHLFDVTGYADETMKLCGDWLTWIKLLLHSDVAYVAKPLNYYRTHRSTVRSQCGISGTETYERMRIFNLMIEKIKISQTLENHIKDTLTHDWITLILARRSTINLRQNLDFYQLSKSCDPTVELRLFRQIVFHLSKKIQRKLKIASS